MDSMRIFRFRIGLSIFYVNHFLTNHKSVLICLKLLPSIVHMLGHIFLFFEFWSKNHLFGTLEPFPHRNIFLNQTSDHFPHYIFLGGDNKNEGSFASEVTANLATGMESSWCEHISVELKGNEPKGLIQLQLRYSFIVGNSCSQRLPSNRIKC